MTALAYVPGILGTVVSPMSLPDTGTGIIQALYPVQDALDGALNVSGLLGAPSGTVLRFASTGTERLYVMTTEAGITVQADVEALILGLPVSPFPAVTLAEGNLYSFGPFHSVLAIPGTTTVQVVLSTTTGVQVLLVQGFNPR